MGEILEWDEERIRREPAAIARLVTAALESPGPQPQAALERLVQVVRRRLSDTACGGLAPQQVMALLEQPSAAARYVGARLVLWRPVERQAAPPGLLRALGEEDAELRHAASEALLLRFHHEPEQLGPHLRSERPWEREAALALTLYPHEVLRPDLRRLLADPVARVRHQTALLLAKDTEAPGLGEVLREVARTSEREDWRARAIESLGAPHLLRESCSTLLDVLKTDREGWVREAAADALGSLAPERSEVARALLDALRDESPSVGVSAARSLARHGATTAEVLPALLVALDDPGVEPVRGHVALALARLGERSVVPRMVRVLEQPDESLPPAFDEVIGFMLQPQSHPVKVQAVEALREAGPLALEAVPALLRCVREGRDMLQLEAARTVLELGTAREELEAVLCEVLPGVRPLFRGTMRKLLSHTRPSRQEALRELVGALEDEEGQESARANLHRVVEARPELLERLVPLLGDEDPRMRSAASRALELLGRPTMEGLERLSRRLESSDASERQQAVGRLRTLGLRAGGVLPGLLERLPRLGPESRVAVLTVLGPVGGGRLEATLGEALRAGLGDAEASVRAAAVWALGDFTPLGDEWVRRLETLRTDEAPEVRGAARRVLQGSGAGSPQEPSVEPEGPRQAVRALRAFAFKQYAALREGEGNRVFSPLSIFTLLTLVLRGARGVTETQLRQSLCWPAGASNVATALRELTARLQGEQEGFTLVSANGFWPQQGHPLREEYRTELMESFDVVFQPVDFESEPVQASRVINEWAAMRTRGRIPEIIDPRGAPPATRYVLANAVYFLSRWERPFGFETRAEPFQLLDGRQVDVPMMRGGGVSGYARGEGYQLIELPYQGRQVSMVVLLPDAGLFDRFERGLEGEWWEEQLAAMTPEDVELRMPRFRFDQHVELTQQAERWGLSALVAPEADLSGMSPVREPFTALLTHDATLTVDEQGTEAAAVTRMTHIGGGPREVEVNRPFLFLLRHVETGAVLFLGRVVDPRSQA